MRLKSKTRLKTVNIKIPFPRDYFLVILSQFRVCVWFAYGFHRPINPKKMFAWDLRRVCLPFLVIISHFWVWERFAALKKGLHEVCVRCEDLRIFSVILSQFGIYVWFAWPLINTSEIQGLCMDWFPIKSFAWGLREICVWSLCTYFLLAVFVRLAYGLINCKRVCIGLHRVLFIKLGFA